ncbi:MAG: hypothetical protein A3B30_03375 [Candidatus Komeilibacteria bacterium RIFCSPLOWO2_01_FULL_52_15]|uniref:Uncharacterized protein n=1 Tax=Candidatus Komeilibacteria bacterium RIFCSPLOWO2_01_FULL_52_15 TaxID=1798551 RepID=A0A1G2BPG9_9BACT|nr:MAG: hypothetical protein A3B30_03375 [Candidatus Komeilibacteria bacterium RIFCSPLOWO2_01_FULL_52_15]
MPIRQLKAKQARSESSFRTRSLIAEGQPTSGSRSVFRSGGPVFPQRRRPDGRRVFLVGLMRFGIFFALLGAIGFAGMVAWYSKDLPDPNKIIQRDVAQSTKIYDRTGEKLLYEIHGTERRTLIELTDIPQYAIDATIAVEDKNFYKHKGLSLTGIVRAILLETASKIGLYKKIVPGGSTLTQQFIKNAVLSTEKSYGRKLKEFILAYRLEQKFSKKEILKLYFNEIPYGSTAYGIEAASHIYFDKSAKDLSLGEAVILAALPQAPSYYSPYGSHRDELISRQRFILKLMVEQGYITQDQAETAKKEEVAFKKKREDIKAPHFVFMVKEELSTRYGERMVEQGGLKIITTLDYDKQQVAETVINDIAPKNLEKYDAQNAALVTIDVKTGQVLALVGSRDYFNDDIDGQVNVATSPRQPGSSIKPIIYAEAFNRGYRPSTTIFDLVTSFAASGKEYRPQDYDGKERGPVTLRQALQGSLNIPAVKMLYLVGVSRAVELAQELGYTTLTDPNRYGLSLVLGGAEVYLIDHVNAYAALAREGVYQPYVDVLRVEQQDGTVLEEHRDNAASKRVLPREAVRELSGVLSDNESRAFIFGANNHLTLPGRPVATKTGTTNDYKDAWTIGYTPSIATGVWVGNSRNESMKKGADGSVVAAPIWQTYMTTILKDAAVEAFKIPEPLSPCSKPMFCGSLENEQVIKINRDNGKLASPYTPLSKIQELRVRSVHSLLHYISKDDPVGPIPEHPEDDPQYPLWEQPIQKWAQENGYTSVTIPTEIDDQYRAQDQPSVIITAPQNNAIINSANYTFTVNVSSPRSIAAVDYYLNDQRIGSSSSWPYSYTFTPTSATPNGTYTLVAAARDDMGNEGRASIAVTLNVSQPNDWQVSVVTPQPGGSYTTAGVPDAITVSIVNPARVKKIDFYLKSTGSPVFIGYKESIDSNQVVQNWTKPQTPGTYALILIITDAFGAVTTLPHISFTVTP